MASESATEKKLAQITELFHKYDVDGNGVISPDEMKSLLVDVGAPACDFEQIFEIADANKDGKVSHTEFLEWMLDGAPQSVKDLAATVGTAPEDTQKSADAVGGMRIRVQTIAGNEVCVQVDGKDGVDTIKSKLEEQLQYPARLQRLLLAERVLVEEGQTLVDLGISEGAELFVIKVNTQPCTLKITGLPYSVSADLCEDVESLKQRIYDDEENWRAVHGADFRSYRAAEPNQQRLVFNGMILKDCDALGVYGIKDGSSILFSR